MLDLVDAGAETQAVPPRLLIPADPGAYSQDALTVGNAAAQREQFVAEHKILQKSYNDYRGVEEAGKELILYAVGDDALAPLKQLYIGFGDTTGLSCSTQSNHGSFPVTS